MLDELPQHPGRVLARLARQVEIALSGTELTLPQYRVLILLCERTEEASSLADKLAVSRPSVTGVVDGLVARGLVNRRHEPDDRRRVSHALTEDGRRVLQRADDEVESRLLAIAELRPSGVEGAFAGLGSWQEALDAHRLRCAAARCATAVSAPAGADKSSPMPARGDADEAEMRVDSDTATVRGDAEAAAMPAGAA